MWFGFKTSFLMPIYIYNEVDVVSLGRVKINDAMKRGMIKIGKWKAKAHNSARIINYGIIEFNGNIEIQGGCVIENYGGDIQFGNENLIAESCKLMCKKNIKFGNNVRVGYESTLMDTDFHYLINLESRVIKNNTKAIGIGEGVWISSNCKIMKGTHIPQGSIVVGNTLLNRDYSTEPPFTIFAGIPGKPIRHNYRRIINTRLEDKISSYFCDNMNEYILSINDFDKLINKEL